MKKILQVSPLENRNVAVTFTDGTSGVFDVAPYIKSDFFKRLEDDAYFKQVGLFLPELDGLTGKILARIPLLPS